MAETDGGLCKAQHHMSPQTVTMFIQSPTEFYFGGLEVFLGCCNPSRYVNRSAWLVACTDIRGCFLLWSKNPCSTSLMCNSKFHNKNNRMKMISPWHYYELSFLHCVCHTTFSSWSCAHFYTSYHSNLRNFCNGE